MLNNIFKHSFAGLQDLVNRVKELSNKLFKTEKKFERIEVLEKQVAVFKTRLRKVRIAIEDRENNTEDWLCSLKIGSIDLDAGLLESRVESLGKKRKDIKEDLTHMKSQSTQNNFIFTGIAEDHK